MALTRTWVNQQFSRRLYKAVVRNKSLTSDEPNIAPINKSRLLPQHKNMLDKVVPYSENAAWIHLTEKYQRKMLGRYGLQSKVSPRICFNSKRELVNQSSESLYNNLNEMVANIELRIVKEKENVERRNADIAAKLEKLDKWKFDLKSKIAKKEMEASAAKEKKDRLIEEVRRHFGFKVDFRDERFKEMLEQRELADKKKQKEAKRKAREEKMIAKIIEKSA